MRVISPLREWLLEFHTKSGSIHTVPVEVTGIQALAQPKETLPREGCPPTEDQAASQALGPPPLGVFKVEAANVLRPCKEGLRAFKGDWTTCKDPSTSHRAWGNMDRGQGQCSWLYVKSEAR